MSDTIYNFSMSVSQLSFFLDKIHDLIAIDNEVLLKINKDEILLYSLVGEKKNINAFKSFIYKTKEVFSFSTEISKEIRYIINNGSKF